MRTLILLLLLSFGLESTAQLAEVRRQPYNFTHNNSAVATDDFIFFDENECDDFDIGCNMHKILKTNHALQVVDSLDISNLIPRNPDDFVNINNMLIGPNGNIYAFIIKAQYTNCVGLESFVLQMDEDLAILNLTKIQTLGDSTDFETLNVVANDSTFLLVGTTSPYCFDGEFGGTIVEIDLAGTVLKSGKIDKHQLWNNHTVGVIYDAAKFGNKYFASVGRYFIEFDDSLQYVNYRFAQPFPAPFGIGYVNLTTQFLQTPNGLPQLITLLSLHKDVWLDPINTLLETRHIGILEMDSNFNTTQIDTFAFTGDSILPGAFFYPHLGLRSYSYTNF
ncbi:MAG: hypothetical protein LAT76_13065, partial [Schleiferiaceae bacterium]|nr:hypothetical protein [Schleiferiaceae bacterium]